MKNAKVKMQEISKKTHKQAHAQDSLRHLGAAFAVALLLLLSAAQEPLLLEVPGAVLGVEAKAVALETVSEGVAVPTTPDRGACSAVSRVTGKMFCFGQNPPPFVEDAVGRGQRVP